jgi:uncharacterized protein (DUF983 family)
MTTYGMRIGRALRRRCPECGGGPLFRRWLQMAEVCPGCGLKLDRGEHDYFLGGYLLNFVGAELVIVAIAFFAIVGTWPDVPWTLITWGTIALMIPLPALTYPFAKTLWLAGDLGFRPPTEKDFDTLKPGSPPASDADPPRRHAAT